MNELFACSKICDSHDHKVRVCINDEHCEKDSKCMKLKQGEANESVHRLGSIHNSFLITIIMMFVSH